MKYRSEIEGLRAIAVLSVIFYHAGFNIFSGGFIGVDIFFVISGYLITDIIYRGYLDNNFKLLNFYEKRIRRIVPPLFIVVIIFIPICFFVLYPRDLREFGQSLISISFFLSNFFFSRNSGYFDLASELRPLLHTWSLSIEVQFYILFPLILIFFLKKNQYYSLFLITIISFLYSQINSYMSPETNFYLFASRIWEFLLGSHASIILKNNSNSILKVKKFLNIIGFFLILGSVFLLKKGMPVPSYYSLPATLGTCLILLCVNTENSLNKFLSNRIFLFIGKISYSLYLWHFFLFSLINYSGINNSYKIKYLLIIATFVFSIGTYLFVEKIFRNKKIISTKNLFLFILLIGLFFNIIGLKLHFSELNKIASYQGFNHWLYEIDFNTLKKNAVTLTSALAKNKDYNDVSINKVKEKKVMIIGDSMAHDAVSALKLYSENNLSFDLWSLTYDDLCLDIDYNSIDCVNSRKALKENSSLITKSDLIIFIVGFQPNTKVENLKILFNENDIKKVRILSSAHFNDPYTVSKKIKFEKLNISDEKQLDLIYGSEIDRVTYKASLRAKKIADSIDIPFTLGYDLQCSSIDEVLSCPFIRNNNILVFDTAHKTIDGLHLYGKQLLEFIKIILEKK